jgi:hypothetical protein
MKRYIICVALKLVICFSKKIGVIVSSASMCTYLVFFKFELFPKIEQICPV